VDEVMEVPGVGRRTAEAVVSGLASRGRVPAAVNTATGEILDVGAGVDDGEGT
jgi:excinuclease ABC subunit C